MGNKSKTCIDEIINNYFGNIPKQFVCENFAPNFIDIIEKIQHNCKYKL